MDLRNYFFDIADALRNKQRSTGSITPNQFPSLIRRLMPFNGVSSVSADLNKNISTDIIEVSLRSLWDVNGKTLSIPVGFSVAGSSLQTTILNVTVTW